MPDASPTPSSEHPEPAAQPLLTASAPSLSRSRRRKAARGLLVCGVVVLLLFGGWWGLRQLAPPVTRQVVAVDEQLVKAEQLAYALEGAKTGWVRIDVRGDQRIDMGSYSKSAEGVLRNRLFVNLQTGEHRSLFNTQQQLLLPLLELARPAPGAAAAGAATGRNEVSQPVASLYQVVRTDSNGDGRLSTQDLAQLYLTRPDGSDGVWLLSPQPVHAVDALHVGDWLLLLDASRPANPVLARFNLAAWQTAPAWPLPALGRTPVPPPSN